MHLSILLPLVLSICIYADQGYADQIVKISYPELTIKNDTGEELVHIHALAQISNFTVDKLRISELSGLAWDQDEGLLHTLSDNGYLFSFKPIFKDTVLHDLILIRGLALHDTQGKRLSGLHADSEGLTLVDASNQILGDTEYIVSFELYPRVVQYNQQGFIEQQIAIPEQLRDTQNYRGRNKALESITLSDQYGLIIGVENALKNEDRTQLFLYTLDGKIRSFPAYFSNSGLTGLTTTADHGLIAIERDYDVLQGFRIALHRLDIEGDQIRAQVIAEIPPMKELRNENFEGITSYKDGLYFMVSDDNNHLLQRTLLLYFSYTGE